jgi:hypothetical protein
LYNFARRLEYGKGIGQDVSRAVKYDRLSAEWNRASAQNSVGISFERELEFNPIFPSRPCKVIKTTQTILVSVSSTAEAFSEPSDSRPNIANLQRIAVISKAN